MFKASCRGLALQKWQRLTENNVTRLLKKWKTMAYAT
jgi:hypothetical protein